MMLKFIGLGLYDERDISVKGLEEAKKCDELYAEFYTSKSPNISKLEELLGKKVKILSRKDVEESDMLIEKAKSMDIGFLVGGDPLCATTHIELILRAKRAGVSTEIIHSSSVFSAVAETGLQIYKFGKTASVVRPEKNFAPESVYDTIKRNHGHTLLLPAVTHHMTANEAMKILLEIEKKRNEKIFTKDTKIVVVARLGGDCLIKYGSVGDLLDRDFGGPPHILVVPKNLHFLEKEMLETFGI